MDGAEPLITTHVGFTYNIRRCESVWPLCMNLPKSWTLIVLGLISFWKEISFRLVMKKVWKPIVLELKQPCGIIGNLYYIRQTFLGISIALYLGKDPRITDDYRRIFIRIYNLQLT
jgi:hypothetical protein